MVNSEMIAELELLQRSRSNKVTEEWTGKLLESVKSVQTRLTNGLAEEGQMMVMLERKLKFYLSKKLGNPFK